jgi:hypothetical protein
MRLIKFGGNYAHKLTPQTVELSKTCARAPSTLTALQGSLVFEKKQNFAAIIETH